MNVLVTGGAGYIGSHAAKRLLREGHSVLILDSLIPGRANEGAVSALRSMQSAGAKLAFVRADIGDPDAVRSAVRAHDCEGVLHFAALAYVRESVDKPLEYYVNNTAKTMLLLEACLDAGIERFVLSSTCATYGQPPLDRLPVREDCPQVPITPYGWSKLFAERTLFETTRSYAAQSRPLAICALRYFNVAGADPDGLLGEHHDPETHLIPTLLRAAMGLSGPVRINAAPKGTTPDGTCVRDYIHVDDLVDAHIRALLALEPSRNDTWAYNLGVGKPASTLEVLRACESVVGQPIPHVMAPAHPGDAAQLFADASAIERDLGWTPKHCDVETMAHHAWNWLRRHPDGYPET
ncbi:MAG: UDP-glucose 4-epimerase GalE [Phycisphaerales bacterium]